MHADINIKADIRKSRLLIFIISSGDGSHTVNPNNAGYVPWCPV